MLQLHNVTVKPSFCFGSETFTRKREDNGYCTHSIENLRSPPVITYCRPKEQYKKEIN
jgi:hypothetical protein